MSNKEGKNILFIAGIIDGHVSGDKEIVKDLVSLGHNVTCYMLDKFENRFKETGAKLKPFSLGNIKIPSNAPEQAILSISLGLSYDVILTDLIKSEKKYDYLLVDSFYDGIEIGNFLKIPKVINICTFIIYKQPFYTKNKEKRMFEINKVNKKFNINIQDFLSCHYFGKTKYKFILTSRLFHPQDVINDTFYFLGPSIDERPIDNTFNFKKEENKKLIYISLGTLFYDNLDFFKKSIETFGTLKEFQVIISIGKKNNVKDLGDLPDNIFVFNYVPQTQILKQTDIFITHGGINSINEGLFLNNLPLIVIPREADQFYNANQIEKLNAGIVLDKNNITPDILKNAVYKYLENEKEYKDGVNKIVESFKEAREDRKKIYEQIIV